MLHDVRCPECGSKHWALFRGTTARCDDCLNTFRLIPTSLTHAIGSPMGLYMSQAELALDDVHDLLCLLERFSTGPVLREALARIDDYWDILEPDRHRAKSLDSKSTLDRQQINS